MEWITRRKSAQLLAGLLTFFVTASAVAQSSSSTSVNAKIAAWQRLSKSRTLPKSTKSQGGPGMDGGGGTGVLLSSGRLRFLDMAAYEKRDLVPFDDQTYARMILKNGRYVHAAGELVKSSDFFSCSDKILSAQENPLLQFLVSKNLEIEIIKTSLPLGLPQADGTATSYQSPSGWVHEVLSLPAKLLKSPTYPEEFQRPIASYSAQAVGRPGGNLFEQTLLISSQLYDLLSERDQCALQVHEVLRYIGSFGRLSQDSGNSALHLLSRPLTTLEIETLTQKIMNGDPVSPSEIPAKEPYKLFSFASRKELKAMSASEYQSLIKRLTEIGALSEKELEEDEASLASTLLLYNMWDNTKLSVTLADQGILEIIPRKAKAQRRELQRKQIDLRRILD